MKKIIVTALMLCLVFSGQAMGSTIYTLDIELNNSYGTLEEINKIGGVQFKIMGDYSDVVLGNAVPSGVNWIFENYGGNWAAVYDDYSFSNPEYAPMGEGTILTLTSDASLTFSDLSFYDYKGTTVGSQHFSTDGFMATVPVPGAVWLLGSGLAGVFGIVRRKRKA